jgi:hypothetical protein
MSKSRTYISWMRSISASSSGGRSRRHELADLVHGPQKVERPDLSAKNVA